MSENPKRIVLSGGCHPEEGEAAATITPGMLLARNSSNKLIPHGTEGGWNERFYACEDALQGKTIDDNYASGDWVTGVLAEPGDVVYALLKAGENADPSEFLMSAGNGMLKVATSTNQRVAVALEAVDNSESGTTDPARIRVRII